MLEIRLILFSLFLITAANAMTEEEILERIMNFENITIPEEFIIAENITTTTEMITTTTELTTTTQLILTNETKLTSKVVDHVLKTMDEENFDVLLARVGTNGRNANYESLLHVAARQAVFSQTN